MNKKHFSIPLLNWYEKNKRDLPWRATKDPYAIWLSEIILQQTRVAQGMDYYLRFLDKYPNIESFAEASEDEIMKLWQGLGYYSRARYMMSTAREIMTVYKGKFPSSYSELIKLKGIGAYTAAAIASISFNEPVVAVDGNVMRFFARYRGIKDTINEIEVRKTVKKELELLIDSANAGNFNQSIIEIGAICCTARNPSCNLCPLSSSCYAFAHNLQGELPVKNVKAKPRLRYFHFLVLESRDNILMFKRGAGDIWQSLYVFPLIETDTEMEPDKLLMIEDVRRIIGEEEVELIDIRGPVKHQLSHQTLLVWFYRFIVRGKAYQIPADLLLVAKEDLLSYGFPVLIDNYLKETKMI